MITQSIQIKKIMGLLFTAVFFGLFLSAATQAQPHNITDTMNSTSMEEATFGAGCFWCVEAVFEEVKGVKSAVAGYAGGEIANPTYRQVSSGQTGHAEVARITFDSSLISYKQLLEVFCHTHNPTTKNR